MLFLFFVSCDTENESSYIPGEKLAHLLVCNSGVIYPSFCSLIQSDTKKRELLKCVVAAMYSWQHCGTGTLSYRQPRHLVIIDQWSGQQRAFAIKMFQFLLGFSKVPVFLCHPVYLIGCQNLLHLV